jgi:hypothetical protein
LTLLVTSLAACSGSSSDGFGDAATGNDGTAAPPYEGGGHTDAATPLEGGTPSDTSAPDSTATDSSPVDTGAGADTGSVTSTDGFGPSRTACIDTINALRAMQSLPPYTLDDTPGIDTCIDEQATNDESMKSAHYSFINDTYPACGYPPFNAQDECEGYGTEPGAAGSGPHGTNGTGIIGCLYSMWAEQYEPDCVGCVGCTAFGGACANCDYSGSMGEGYECGHYVNMSASYFY